MQPVDLLIEHGLVVTMNEEETILPDGSVAISGGEIAAVGPADDLGKRFSAAERIDAANHVVMPGLINAHTHIPMTLFRGLADDLPLEGFLEKMWVAESRFLRPDTISIGTRLALAEMIASGTTTALDMYWLPHPTAETAREVGFRLINGFPVVEVEGPDGLPIDERIAHSRAYLQTYQGDPLITPCVLAHGTYTVSPDHLAQAYALAEEFGTLFHIHVSESAAEVQIVKERYGRTPPELLDDLGMLSERAVLAHCVQLSAGEIDLLAERGAKVVHCPLSNLKSGAGIAPIPQMRAAAIPVLLGTDGAASGNDLDLWKVMRLAAVLHRGVVHDPTLNPAPEAVRMATCDAARALGLGEQIGSLEAGKRADIILIDLDSPHLVPMYDVYSYLVYAVGRDDVKTVLIDGQIVMRDHTLLTVDVPGTMEQARELAKQIEAEV
jgi:5-methylthioadenosine/S-adenosylhomocysteine deaminase